MGYLTIPYTVLYESKNYVSGLSNIRAMVRKPNGVLSGPYTMTELSAPFLGRYSFDFFTSDVDPEGEYFAMIVSQSENFQVTERISLYNPPGSGGGSSTVAPSEVVGFIPDTDTAVAVIDDTQPIAFVQTPDTIKADVSDEELVSEIQPIEQIFGTIEDTDEEA